MNTEMTVSREMDPLTIIDGADLADTTKTKYRSVLTEFLDGGGSLADPGSLAEFAAGLSNSRRAHLKAGVGLWAKQMTTLVKGSATPGNVNAATASVMRFEALTDAVKVKQPKGTKAHTWLSLQEVKKLYNAVDNGIQGARDKAVLGLLVAAGLRREEAVSLTFEDIKDQKVKDKTRWVLQVKGKGAKNRVVPISDQLHRHLVEWGEYVGHQGLICRSIGRLKEPGDSLSAVGLFKLVQKFGAVIDTPSLAPHDLRRTYAQLGFEAGIPITQLSILLGHSSVAVTQRYLNLKLNLETTVSDFIPWG